MRVQLSAADPILVAMAVYWVAGGHVWWLITFPLVILSWFINPRWSKAEGFRFWVE